uniref:ABC transporter domain-containing protein n=1 Tax=Panagrolaimus sp. JU765 TaxID=591449 RepID=A0AC34Q995_9BILA
MFIGLLLVPLFALIVQKSTTEVIDGREFEPVQITGNRLDIGRYVRAIPRISTRMCNGNRTFGYVTDSDLGEMLMKKFEGRYTKFKFAVFTEKFDDLETMKKTLQEDLNSTATRNCGTYMGGVHIQEVDLANKKFTYKIYVTDREGINWQSEKFWPDDGPYAPISDLNYIPGSPRYWPSGYLTFKYALDSLFLEQIGRDLSGFEVFLARMPTPRFRNNGLLAILKAMPVVFVITVLAVMIHTAKEIVAEKEVGIKTHLMVMGLNSAAFYASHFVVAFFKAFFVMGISAIILSFGFESIAPTVFISFCLLFAVAAVVFSVMISVFFKRTALVVIAVIVLWLGSFALDAYMKLVPTDIGVALLQSLNIFTAFHYGLLAMGRYESRLSYLSFSNIFAETTSFSIGLAYVMMIVDILFMVLIIFYFDAVWPTDDSPKRSPWFICPFVRQSDVADKMDLESNGTDFTDNCETDNYAGKDEADVCVRKMCKVWDDGQVAVDGLSLNAYRGHVTVLLGYNGAGKSTTFSVISGISSATRGEVLICKKEISRNLSECQKHIGYCPQYNPLFEKLTVEEHLRLYGKLKVEVWDETSEQRMRQLIAANQLSEKANELAGNLSGGMKRKLCVAMSLIGDSRVILLDEPTAGMDPEARHEICKVLENEKKNRTILLTTHYMDEADLLGDQIAIMVRGRLACRGSPEFLKNRFGTGYVLTMVINPLQTNYTENDLEVIRKKLLSVVKKHAAKAEIDSSTGLQFSVILPTQDKQYFGNLFEELEFEKENLQLSSFGLSFNTLEQVFLKVGEIAESQEDHVDSGAIINNACRLFDKTEEGQPEILEYFTQIATVINRYVFNAYQNKIRTCLPLILALSLFSVVAFSHSATVQKLERDLSLTSMEPVTIPIQLTAERPSIADFNYIAGKLPGCVVLSLPEQSNYSKEIIRHYYDLPALGIGAYIAKNNSVFLYFNGAAYHAPALALSFLSNAILQDKLDSIRTSIEVFSTDSMFGSIDDKQAPMSVASVFINMLTILCFSFLTSGFVMPLVEDRESRFKHQFLLTKLNKLRYWIAVTLWNAFIYIFFCFFLAVILFLSGSMQDCMRYTVSYWLLYFWCAVPFVFVASFIFTSPFKGFVALLTWNILAGIIASLTIVVLNLLSYPNVEKYLVILFSIMSPSFALGHGIVDTTMLCAPVGFLPDRTTFFKIIICMAISGLVYWIILLVIEKTYAELVHALLNKMHGGYDEVDQVEDNEDEDVQAERHRMNRTANQDLALAVRDVSKYFGKFCAVRKLTFGVSPTDCFGLLGINGAGKTTTFDILTGRSLPSKGNAFVGGVDIKNMPVIGYCPQFDALALDLTGRQTLALIGRLNGFTELSERVECVLESIQMTSQADKLVMHYSGGQKRRLSIGITLMSRASLIMLDEPTAGIDPKTRRHIWNLLSAIRDRKVAILLASHSMDECEALCSKIGFLNKGSLISIGTSQHLKSRYGSSFLLTFTVANPSLKTMKTLDNVVTTEFGAQPCQDLENMNTYHWEIPRCGNDLWSNMYKRAQNIALSYSFNDTITEKPIIKDFSVTQNSLEQVFLRLTQLGACLEDEEAHDSARSAG